MIYKGDLNSEEIKKIENGEKTLKLYDEMIEFNDNAYESWFNDFVETYNLEREIRESNTNGKRCETFLFYEEDDIEMFIDEARFEKFFIEKYGDFRISTSIIYNDGKKEYAHVQICWD